MRCLTRLLLLVLSMRMGSSSEASRILEGIHLPLEKNLIISVINAAKDDACHPQHRLRFNGAGVRSVNMFGWDFKIYVAGFYTTTDIPPLESAESVFAALDDGTPMQMDFTFLRSVNQGRVTNAWKQQTEHSVEHTYQGYEKDFDFFINCFGPIENGGTETVQLLADGRTVIIDQGVHKGIIEGKDFQKAFLSMWFGAKAVASDLKAGLLGSLGHFGLQAILHNSEEIVVALEG